MVLYFTTTLNYHCVAGRKITMFRLTRSHRYRVSNQLAVLAAFLLIAASAASVERFSDESRQTGPAMVQNDTAAAGNTASVNNKMGFRVSLYLFRRN
mgnify:CR=1 FL=1